MDQGGGRRRHRAIALANTPAEVAHIRMQLDHLTQEAGGPV